MSDREDVRDALRRVASHGVPGPHAALFDVGSTDFLDHFSREVLDQLVRRGGSTCRFIEGPYGAGKTHLIRMISERALDRGLVVAEAELSRDLALQDWHSITAYVLQKMSIRRDGRVARSLPKILDALRAAGHEVGDLSSVHVPHPGFRQAIAVYLENHNLSAGARALLKRYLLGERISVVELRKKGVRGIKAPLSRRNAEHVMNSVVTTLHALGLPGTLLVFDENERTLVSATGRRVPKRVKVAANLVRRLVDACPSGRVHGLVTVFAVLPGFLRQCAEAYPALGQRLARPIGSGASWRAPVLTVTETGSSSGPDEFLELAVQRFLQIAAQLSVSHASLAPDLMETGHQVLAQHAGDGYRRPLMKALADRTLTGIEGLD